MVASIYVNLESTWDRIIYPKVVLKCKARFNGYAGLEYSSDRYVHLAVL